MFNENVGEAWASFVLVLSLPFPFVRGCGVHKHKARSLMCAVAPTRQAQHYKHWQCD